MSQVQQVVCCYSCYTFQGESQIVYICQIFATQHLVTLVTLRTWTWLAFWFLIRLLTKILNIFSANCQEEQQQVAVQDLPGETEHQEGLLLWSGCWMQGRLPKYIFSLWSWIVSFLTFPRFRIHIHSRSYPCHYSASGQGPSNWDPKLWPIGMVQIQYFLGDLLCPLCSFATRYRYSRKNAESVMEHQLMFS